MPQGTVGVLHEAIQQSLYRGRFVEDEIVAVFHLGHVQLMPEALLPFGGAEDGQQARQPVGHGMAQVVRAEGYPPALADVRGRRSRRLGSDAW